MVRHQIWDIIKSILSVYHICIHHKSKTIVGSNFSTPNDGKKVCKSQRQQIATKVHNVWLKSIFFENKNYCVQNGAQYRMIGRILYLAVPTSWLYDLMDWILCSDDWWHVQTWQMLCGLKQYWLTWISQLQLQLSSSSSSSIVKCILQSLFATMTNVFTEQIFLLCHLTRCAIKITYWPLFFPQNISV